MTSVLAYFYLEHCNAEGLKEIGEVSIKKSEGPLKMH